jgi:hypothetical protein
MTDTRKPDNESTPNGYGDYPADVAAAREFFADTFLGSDEHRIEAGKKLCALGISEPGLRGAFTDEWCKVHREKEDPFTNYLEDHGSDCLHAYRDAKHSGLFATESVVKPDERKRIKDEDNALQTRRIAEAEKRRKERQAEEDRIEDERHRAAMVKKFPGMTFDDIAEVEREWLAKNFIPAKCVTLYSGDGGAGKTGSTLQLAIATAIGGEWFGIQLGEPRRVLYLSYEEGRREIAIRIKALLPHYGLTAVPGNLKIVDMTERENVTLWDDGDFGDGWDFFADHIDVFDPALIVIDALSFVYAGDANDRAKVTAFGRELNALKRTIVLCSHPSDSGMRSGKGTANSTAWRNSARAMLYIRPPSGNYRHFKIECTKANYGPTGGRLFVDCDDAGVFTLATDAKAARAAADKPDARPEFLALLAKINATGEGVTDKAKAKTYAPTVFGRMREATFNRNDFESAMRVLLEDGSIRLVEFRNVKRRRCEWRLEAVDFG